MERKNSLRTTFADIELLNPIIVASCGLTGSAESNQRLASAGVGAIVLKSLFEEDIIRESATLREYASHTEAADYMEAYMESIALNEYLELIRHSKALCGSTPIIASINCCNSGEWVEYARVVEMAGADALELNVMTVERDPMSEDGDLEQRHIAIAKSVRQAIDLPIIMKLGSSMSNHPSIISRLRACGINGFVLFNRLYPLDIDVEEMSYSHSTILSSVDDLSTPLRHIAITSAAVPTASLALSGGVQGWLCILKSLLAGASAVEVSSILYRQGSRVEEWVCESLELLAEWMHHHNFDTINALRGALNNASKEHRDSIMRTQFLTHTSKIPQPY